MKLNHQHKLDQLRPMHVMPKQLQSEPKYKIFEKLYKKRQDIKPEFKDYAVVPYSAQKWIEQKGFKFNNGMACNKLKPIVFPLI